MIRTPLLVALAACTLHAGPAQGQIAQAPVRSERRAQVVAGAVETRITPNRPYSGESVTEITQLLPDGNRISRTTVTKVYRDSAGRTRRDMYASDSTLASIAISDPVGHATYTLDPQRKIAYRTARMVGLPASAVRAAAPGEPGAGASRQRIEAAPVMGAPVAPATRKPGYAATTNPRITAAGSPAGDGDVKREDLGTQNIEGVLATGTRTTTIIPAGQIGNAQEIRIVSERWFSDELEVLVMTRHSDPRTGETTYRLRNILRAEPDPALFAVPSDYTIQERRIRKPE